MHIRKLEPAHFAREYDILTQRQYPWADVVKPPFGSLVGVIEPGNTSKPHNHHEGETFFIVSGRGLMKVDEETAEVEAGDLIYMPPFTTHSLTNLSETDNLTFLTVWWEDMKLLTGSEGEAGAADAAGRRVLVTATPPTPNGDLHLGHLSGPYTGADIYNRFLKMNGVQSGYLSGADDHQSYVPLKAGRIGLTPRETADKFAVAITETLAMANIHPDLFVRPETSEHHIPMIKEFLAKLHKEGKLIEREIDALYCDTCDKYLYEAHVSGNCPHCRAGSDGNACEQCGRPNTCADLLDASCKHCRQTPGTRKFKQLFFPLSQYEDKLKAFWANVSMGPHMHALCEKMLADGLPDIPITHLSDWGIEVPVEGYEEHRIYVWFEMAPGYLAATSELTGQGWESVWKNQDAEIVQFFGFDNGYFHAVLFPALFMAYDEEIRLPDAFVTNEFFRLEGLKFSTSRGHAIWGREMLAQVSSDIVRFYLSYNRPETEQTNFEMKHFEDTVEQELVKGWNGWLQGLLAKTEAEYGGIVPDAGAWSSEHRRFFQSVDRLVQDAAAAYEAKTFSPQQATRLLCELARTADRFGKAEAHLQGIPSRKDERRTGIALELLAAKTMAMIAAPILPEFAHRLWRDLGFTTDLRWEGTPTFVPGGQKVTAPASAYFTSVIGALREREAVTN